MVYEVVKIFTGVPTQGAFEGSISWMVEKRWVYEFRQSNNDSVSYSIDTKQYQLNFVIINN